MREDMQITVQRGDEVKVRHSAVRNKSWNDQHCKKNPTHTERERESTLTVTLLMKQGFGSYRAKLRLTAVSGALRDWAKLIHHSGVWTRLLAATRCPVLGLSGFSGTHQGPPLTGFSFVRDQTDNKLCGTGHIRSRPAAEEGGQGMVDIPSRGAQKLLYHFSVRWLDTNQSKSQSLTAALGSVHTGCRHRKQTLFLHSHLSIHLSWRSDWSWLVAQLKQEPAFIMTIVTQSFFFLSSFSVPTFTVCLFSCRCQSGNLSTALSLCLFLSLG